MELSSNEIVEALGLESNPSPGAMKELNSRHHTIAYMLAMGISQAAVCKELDYTPGRLSLIANDAKMKMEIARIRAKFLGRTIEERIGAILPEAVTTAEDIMNDPQAKENVRADIAFKFMDRVMGRPKQSIETNNHKITELFSRLDSLEKTQGAIVVDSGIKSNGESKSVSLSKDAETPVEAETTDDSLAQLLGDSTAVSASIDPFSAIDQLAEEITSDSSESDGLGKEATE